MGKKEKRYFLHVDRIKANHAGSKAVDDCEKILLDAGWMEINVYSMCNVALFRKIKRAIEILGLLRIKQESIVTIQHPLYVHHDYFKILRWLKERRGLKYIFVIHDLESARHILPDSKIYEARDKIMYAIADGIICHNHRMHEFLVKEGVEEQKIYDLEIFDYLCNGESDSESLLYENDDEAIVIAGNLSAKTCEYIYKLPNELINCSFNLYGVNFDGEGTGRCLNYKGSFEPDILPSVMVGKFGLVWYGNDLDSCGGVIEDYLQYINPHKTSLYIAAGLPVIISRNIGLAEFIEKNNLGIVIDTLQSLKEKIESIDEKQYMIMKQNVLTVAQKLKAGHYFLRALTKCEEFISNE